MLGRSGEVSQVSEALAEKPLRGQVQKSLAAGIVFSFFPTECFGPLTYVCLPPPPPCLNTWRRFVRGE